MTGVVILTMAAPQPSTELAHAERSREDGGSVRLRRLSQGHRAGQCQSGNRPHPISPAPSCLIQNHS